MEALLTVRLSFSNYHYLPWTSLLGLHPLRRVEQGRALPAVWHLFGSTPQRVHSKNLPVRLLLLEVIGLLLKLGTVSAQVVGGRARLKPSTLWPLVALLPRLLAHLCRWECVMAADADPAVHQGLLGLGLLDRPRLLVLLSLLGLLGLQGQFCLALLSLWLDLLRVQEPRVRLP